MKVLAFLWPHTQRNLLKSILICSGCAVFLLSLVLPVSTVHDTVYGYAASLYLYTDVGLLTKVYPIRGYRTFLWPLMHFYHFREFWSEALDN